MAKKKYTAERVAKLVKNPGTRATVPTKYLPANYRAQREENTRLAQPVTPGSSLTNRDAARERNATVDLRYGPLDQQLTSQLQLSQQQQQQIPGYFDQYRAQVAAAQQGIQQGYNTAVGQIAQLQAGVQAPAQQQAPQVAALGQEIQNLGGIPDPQNAQIAAQAAAGRGAMAGNLGAVVAAQGAGANAYGANLYANTGQHQAEALLKELGQERTVRDNQTQLAREKGAYRTTTDQAIRDRESKGVLERAAFNLNVANTNADNARADATATTQADSAAADDARQATQDSQQTAGPGGTYSRSEWAKMTPEQRTKAVADYNKQTRTGAAGAGANGVKPATPSQRNTANSQISYARQVARAAHAKNIPRSKIAAALVAGQAARSVVDEKKYQELIGKGEKPADARRKATRQRSAINKTDQFWASVALDVEYDNHLSRANQQKLQSMGYSVRDLGLPSYGARSDRPTPNRPTSVNGRPHG